MQSRIALIMDIQHQTPDTPNGNDKAFNISRPDQMPVDYSRQIIQKSGKTIFGPFSLDHANAVLTRNQEALTLTPKAFALLSYLLDSAGQLLTKEVIFEQLWPGVVVTDAALTVCIREIRKVLGDSSKSPRYIETVHKRGFRFKCTVSSCTERQGNNMQNPVVKQSAPNFVGREKPLAIMQQCLLKAQMGVRQVVFVTGEPGIGKTTLVETFLNQNLTNTNAWVAKGQCIEHYGAGEAYLPILDALSEMARKETTELAKIIAQYAPTWIEHLPALNGALERSDLKEKINDVFPERMLRELTGALEAIAEKRPLILILEDLHWSDHATIELLSFLARRTRPVSLLIVATYRPADAVAQNHPVNSLNHDLHLRDYCSCIPLEFLDEQHIDSYLLAVFPEHKFPEQFTRIIHQQSDGNPLFIINLLKYLENAEFIKMVDGHWQLTGDPSNQSSCLPDDLKIMIDQQVDQLDPQCQKLLEAASIASEPGGVAVQFTLAEVAAAVGIDALDVEPCLEMLSRNGHFLHSQGVAEWPDGSLSNVYEFTHALYQNVLYRRVSSARKVQLHQRLGIRLEQGYGFRSVEIANQLAVHFEIGRDYSRAVQYLQQAADTTARRGANREAIQILNKAQQLLTKLPQTEQRDRLELSLLLLLAPVITVSQGNATPEIEICYLRARELCEQLGEKSELFRVLFGLRSFYLIQGNLDKAHQLAQTLLGLATMLNDSGFLLEAHVGLASSEWFSGNLKASHQHALQGIGLYEKDIHAEHSVLYGLDPGVFCYARAGQTIWPQGYPDQALDFEKKAVDLATTLDHPYSLVFAIHNLTQIFLYRQDGDAALASSRRGKALALQHGFSFLIAWAYYLSAWAYALVGDKEKARAEIYKANTVERPVAPAADSYLSIYLAETYLLLGDHQQGLSSLAIPCKEHSYDAERLYLQAEFILLSDDSITAIHKAEALFKESREASYQQKLKAYELRAAISLCKLLMRQNRNLEAFECLATIFRWFQEGFDTLEYQQAKMLLEQLGILLKKDRRSSNVVYLDSVTNVAV